MRLDKFLCDKNIGSRSQVKDYVRKGLVTVNGRIIRDSAQKVVPETDEVAFQGKVIFYRQFVYYMLNKPAGVVSATSDRRDRTVLDLLPEQEKGLFPVGRLDRDTEGLLLITSDGELAHRLLSPAKHVDKTYLVTIKHPLEPGEIQALEQGVAIGDKRNSQDSPGGEEQRLTLPAKVEVISDTQIHLTIHEGRFHQVKRMLKAVNNEVLALKRIHFGPLTLDPGLAPGESRPLKEEELALLYENR